MAVKALIWVGNWESYTQQIPNSSPSFLNLNFLDNFVLTNKYVVIYDNEFPEKTLSIHWILWLTSWKTRHDYWQHVLRLKNNLLCWFLYSLQITFTFYMNNTILYNYKYKKLASMFYINQINNDTFSYN